MERARENNSRFNPTKLKFKKPEVGYVGGLVGADGQKPDPEKVRAIKEMPDPECKEDLMRIMGMLNYLSQFIPNMADIAAPLRQLLRKDVPWSWYPEHAAALEKLKCLISSKPVLSFFDQSKPTIIQCDASSGGLGACLLQEDHPVAFASRSLIPAEKNYSQIEKELLAILFSVNKFHQYVYGRQVEVHSDHKPLESITRKPLHKASPRLQQMLLKLMRYDLNVTYKPGKNMYIADALSRAYPETLDVSTDPPEALEYRVHSVEEKLPMSKARISEMQMATLEDPMMQALIGVCESGWTSHRWSAPELVRPYWHLRDEIYSQDGLVFVAEKLLIPRSMRPEMLKKIHEHTLAWRNARRVPEISCIGLQCLETLRIS
jgi:hypothetical protein